MLQRVVDGYFKGDWDALAATLEQATRIQFSKRTRNRWRNGGGAELPDLLAIARLPKLDLSLDWLVTGDGSEKRNALSSASTVEADLRAFVRAELSSDTVRDEVLEEYLIDTASLKDRLQSAIQRDLVEWRRAWKRKRTS